MDKVNIIIIKMAFNLKVLLSKVIDMVKEWLLGQMVRSMKENLNMVSVQVGVREHGILVSVKVMFMKVSGLMI